MITDRKIRVNLTGPDGNVFCLIAMGSQLCDLLDIDRTKFTQEMKSGDYENAVMTFQKYFGEFFILHR